MSSTYYNNMWKEGINNLLENIHEEFDPLDENLAKNQVLLLAFRSPTSGRTNSGSGFTPISTSSTCSATRSSKTAMTRWCTLRRECSSKICWSRPCCGSSKSSSTSSGTTPTPTLSAQSTSTSTSSSSK